MQEYERMGAVIHENINEAQVILGVKSVPIDLLEHEKTYCFFSHTIKAQEANMPLLDAILEKNIRLIDYEKMVDEHGRRVVAFGKYAGVAGMINILHGLGLRLLALGHHTPFMYIGPAHNYRHSYMAKSAIREAGYEIALGLMPKSIGPLTFVFTGSGNVSLGAQEMFRNLPHEYIDVNHLQKVAEHGNTNVLYACVVDMEDNLVRKSDGTFCRDEYMEHPERYTSIFSTNIAPYASVIINGIYWAPGAPRLMTIPDAKTLLRPQVSPWLLHSLGCPKLPHRLLAICDISADPGGSIEFMKECTTINHPFQLYDAEQHVDYESFSGEGVLICSIDNMPAQLPREATEFFGSLLMPHVHDILKSDAREPFEKLQCSPVVKNAIITSNGSLTPNFRYIDDLRHQKREKNAQTLARRAAQKKVLMLGAGYVSAPVVDYLTRDPNISLTIASNIKTEVDNLADRFPNTIPVLVEIDRRRDELEKLIHQHDLVISLLPYTLHPDVAKLCIKCRVNMVTASYRSPAMMELDSAAKEANITVVNEVGVDPGIDHMLAMQCFDDIRVRNGKIRSFVSWCGGIPAPENSNNPLRYKFNWSPRGVLFNMMSGAKFLENGELVEIPGDGELLVQGVRHLDFMPGFNLEGYPNRDSLIYQKLYGIEQVHTMLRGSIRYKGFSRAARGLLELGLIDPKPHPFLHPDGPDITWRAFICELLGKKSDIFYDSLKDIVHARLHSDDVKLHSIEDLGLLDNAPIVKKSTPLDTLSHYLAKRLAYSPGERDVLIMRHDIGVEWPNQNEETIHVDFVVYGNPDKYSAMAATVGYPTAIAAKMVLDGEIQAKGMILPFAQDIYRPIVKRLEAEGLIARESSTVTRVAPVPEEEAVRY
jgi:alpha-aminoadipic semialdehyde synthase